ncbi:PorP/SprF family type IX secretion system membrane protein [Mucilaginibacter paludis]|uniref:Membrane protein n=1 Tax=Mucilaginibacter paludis DSM 18603 TaxID=714943 RepID=H1XZB0_9SPHI|nr:PorP/SprF family type IX secretion system membrane protein [Mucilaginibacter paludis]EHQ25598.1 putative membrane protein [Mucilaginibacter paludis DSM 18603]
MSLIQNSRLCRRQLFAFLFSAIIILTVFDTHAQQTSFTQYMDNLTPVNPAFSLRNDGAGTISTAVRKQWVGVPGAPTTYLFNGDFPIQSMDGSAGLIIRDDQFSVEHLTTLNVFLAKSIQINDFQHLAVSINAGFKNYIANYSSLGYGDALLTNINEREPNMGFGVMFYDDDYYFGVSVPEISLRSLGVGSVQTNQSFRNNYYLTGAFYMDLNEDFKIKPASLVSYTRGVPVIADISTTLYAKDTYGLGVNYRTNNEVATILSFKTDSFHIGYSYQFGTASNNIGSFSNATHEIMLSFHFDSPNSKPLNMGQ